MILKNLMVLLSLHVDLNALGRLLDGTFSVVSEKSKCAWEPGALSNLRFVLIIKLFIDGRAGTSIRASILKICGEDGF